VILLFKKCYLVDACFLGEQLILKKTLKLLNKVIKYFKSYINKGHTRSIAVKKNIVLSVLIKGGNVLIGLLLVPLTLHYLNSFEYGVWLTLSSILGWLYFFDIGLGNGLRNKLAEAKVRGDVALGRTYVSTSFALLLLISIGLLLLFIIINPFLDWAKILNTGTSLAQELSKIALIVFTFFCLQFVFRLVSAILLADQKSAMSDFLNLCGNAFALGIIFILTKITKGSLLSVSIVFSAAPAIVFLIAGIVMFNGRYKDYSPSVKFLDFSQINDLVGLGVKFFIIQLVCLVLFTTTNIIISKLFSPAEVTPYNIAFKYFSVMMMIFSIALSPFWTAYTDAYHRGEIVWIRRSTKRLVAIWGILCVGLVIMVLLANWAYRLWVGNEIHIPKSLSIITALFVAISCWNNIFALFLNGVGKIKLQLYSGIFVGIINIPLSIALAKLLHSVDGIVLSTCLCLLISSVWSPIQYLKIVNGTAKGIWNK
jgi:O-antigen/teichoic acid export membrane protein